MKKLLLVFLLVLGTTVTKGQFIPTLSGMTIEQRTLNGMYPTIISGVPGVIVPQRLNTGQTYMLIFYPSDAGKPNPILRGSDGDMLRVYFEDRYGIEFSLYHDHRNWETYKGMAKKDGYTYVINVNVRENPPLPLMHDWFIHNMITREEFITNTLIADPLIYVWFKFYRDDLYDLHEEENIALLKSLLVEE